VYKLYLLFIPDESAKEKKKKRKMLLPAGVSKSAANMQICWAKILECFQKF
jgi:hypothetical protein